MESEKHFNTTLSVILGDMRDLWAEASDNQRLEIIKSVIWTAPDMHGFYAKVKRALLADKFQNTLD